MHKYFTQQENKSTETCPIVLINCIYCVKHYNLKCWQWTSFIKIVWHSPSLLKRVYSGPQIIQGGPKPKIEYPVSNCTFAKVQLLFY